MTQSDTYTMFNLSNQQAKLQHFYKDIHIIRIMQWKINK